MKQEQIQERAEKLLSTLLILHRTTGKTMTVTEFKSSLTNLPSSLRVYKSLIEHKIVGRSGDPYKGFKIHFATEVHPNIEMAKRIINSIASIKSQEKKAVKTVPHTMYGRGENYAGNYQKFLADLTAMKLLYEIQNKCKISINVELQITKNVTI